MAFKISEWVNFNTETGRNDGEMIVLVNFIELALEVVKAQVKNRIKL